MGGSHSNGVKLATRTSNFIGRSNWSNERYFKGIIDELTIYNYEVTSE